MGEDEIKAIYKAHRDNGASPDEAMRAVDLAVNGPSQEGGPTPEKPSMLGGLTRAAAQGATFGTSDEMMGALGGAAAGIHHAITGTGPTVGEEYNATVESERAKQKAFAAEHPVASTLAEIGGGVAGTIAGGELLGAGRAAAAAPAATDTALGWRMLGGAAKGAAKGAVGGAVFGGLSGAGSAEGGASERLAGAARGAVTGALVGAPLGAAGGFVAPAIPRALDATGLRPQSAASPFSKYLGIESIEDRANRLASGAMGQEGLTAADIRNTALRTPDKPIMLAESGMPGGPMEQALSKSEVPAQTRARIMIGTEARTMGAPTRIQSDLERRSGVARVPTAEQAAQITDERAAGSAPLYEKAYAVGAVDDPQITELLKRPAAAKAVGRAMQIAANEGDNAFAQWIPNAQGEEQIKWAANQMANQLGMTPEEAMQLIRTKSNMTVPAGAAPSEPAGAGDIQAGLAHPTVKMLDYVKQAMDAMLPEAKQAAGGVKTKEYRAISGLKDALLERLDAQVPEYKAARDFYAGKSALLNAHDAAQELFDPSTDYRDAASALKGMSDSEKQAFRSSAVDDLLYRAGNQTPNNVADWLDKNPNMREKVKLLFDRPQDAEHFIGDLQSEQRMAVPPIPKPVSNTTGSGYTPYPSKTGLAVYGLRNLLRNPARDVTTRTGNEMAGLMSAGLNGPQERQAAVQRLEAYAQKKPFVGIGKALRRGATVAAGLDEGRP